MDTKTRESADHESQRHCRKNPRYGWIIVAASFYLNFVACMDVLIMSVFLNEFEEHFQLSATTLSILAGTRRGVVEFSGVITGLLVAQYGCRKVAVVAVFIATFSTIGSAYITNFYLILIVFGIISAFAVGALYTPANIIVQQYFSQQKRALAAGVVSSGLSVATLTSAPLLRLTINHYGWRGGLVVAAAFNAQALVAACLLRPPRQDGTSPPPKVAKYGDTALEEPNSEVYTLENSTVSHIDTQDASSSKEHRDDDFNDKTTRENDYCSTITTFLGFTLFTNKTLALFLLSNLLTESAPTIFLTYSISRAIEQGVDKTSAAFVTSAIGCGSLTGRLLTGYIGSLRCTNRLVQQAIAMFMISIVTMASTICGSKLYLHLLFGVFFGLSYGCFGGLYGTVLVDLAGVENAPKAYTWSSLMSGIVSFMILPSAGWLLVVAGNYTLLYFVHSVISIIGGLVILGCAIIQWKQRTKN